MKRAESLVCSCWTILPVSRGDQCDREGTGMGSGGSKFKSQLCHLPAVWWDNYVNLEFLISEFGISVQISQNFVRN